MVWPRDGGCGASSDDAPPLQGTAPHATMAMGGIALDPPILLREDVKKGARGWTQPQLKGPRNKGWIASP